MNLCTKKYPRLLIVTNIDTLVAIFPDNIEETEFYSTAIKSRPES